MIFRKKNKIFCIGANKTGTTSVETALMDLGFKLGDQNQAQYLIKAYAKRDFKTIVKFCKSADAFQDAPFSWHYTGIMMDQSYPNAKFVLTVRNSADEWYQSLTRFHSKRLKIESGLPTVEDLKKAKRSKERTMWDNFNVRHVIDDNDPYNKERLIKYYLDHVSIIIDYFRFKNNLLIINLSNKNSYREFCKFLDVTPIYDEFPWKNKT